MDQIFEELSSRIEERILALSLINEKCKEFLRPWRCDEENEAETEATLMHNAGVSTEEKEHIQLIEKALAKAVKIRTTYEQKEENQKKDNKKLTGSSARIGEKRSTGSARPPPVPTKNVLPLSQVQSIRDPKAPPKSPGRKPSFRPAHLSAPYKTFGQFRFPARSRVPRRLPPERTSPAPMGASGEAAAGVEGKPPAVPEASGPSRVEAVGEEAARRGRSEGGGKEGSGSIFISLADIGSLLKMPPQFCVLSTRNEGLRTRVAEAGREPPTSGQEEFARRLESHMRAGRSAEVTNLFGALELLGHHTALLRLCRALGRVRPSDSAPISELRPARMCLAALLREFGKRSDEAKELLRRGDSLSKSSSSTSSLPSSEHFRLSPFEADDILSAGFRADGAQVVYGRPGQLDAHQVRYERLVSLRVGRLLLGLVAPEVERLKGQDSTDSRDFRQMFRLLHSLVWTDGRLFPAVIGDVTDER